MGLTRARPAGDQGRAVDEPLNAREIEAVRQAFARVRVLAAGTDDRPSRLALRLACQHLVRPPATSGPRPLSERQIDVLALAAIGLHNREIAARLGLTAETVKSYLRSALPRLGAHTRYEAVVAARRAGLLP